MEMCGAVIGVSLLALALALAMESYGTHPSQLAAAGAMQSLAMRTLKREQWPVHGTQRDTASAGSGCRRPP